MFSLLFTSALAKIRYEHWGFGQAPFSLKNQTKAWERWHRLEFNGKPQNFMKAKKMIIKGVPIIVPEKRIDMIKDALISVKEGKGQASGSKRMIATMDRIFVRNPITNKGEAYIGAGWSQRKGATVEAGVKICWQKRAEEANKGSVQVGGGWSQHGGGHISGGATWSWQKKQEEANKGSAHVGGGWSQTDGAHISGGASWSWQKQQEEANKRSAHVGGGWSQHGGAHVTGSLKGTFGSKGQHSVGAQGGWSQHGGAHVSGSLKSTFGSKGQHSVGVQGGWSQHGGAHIGATATFHFVKEGEQKTLYVHEIETPEGFVYLPSCHKNTFDNLRRQFVYGTATISE